MGLLKQDYTSTFSLHTCSRTCKAQAFCYVQSPLNLINILIKMGMRINNPSAYGLGQKRIIPVDNYIFFLSLACKVYNERTLSLTII